MNKRASISDVLFIGVSLIVLIIAVTIGFFFSSEIATNSLFLNNSVAANITQVSQDFYCGTPDNLALFVMFGSLVIAVMLAFLFGQQSIFKAITIVMLILFMGVSVIFQMWGEEFFSSSIVANLVACMPKTQFIMEHFVIFALLSSALIIIALFYRGGSGREF